MSPTLMERYLSAAQKISRTAVGTPPPSPTVDYFRVADDLRAGAAPARACRSARAAARRSATRSRWTPSTRSASQLSRDLNEQRADLRRAAGARGQHRRRARRTCSRCRASPRLPGTAGERTPRPRATPTRASRRTRTGSRRPGRGRRRGTRPAAGRGRSSATAPTATGRCACRSRPGTRDVQVAFLKQTSALDETARLPFLRPYPAGVNIAETRTGAYLRSVEISGPYDPTGPADSPSRRRIFVCQPAQRRRTKPACATHDPHDAGAPRVPPAGDRRRRRAAARVLPRGPRTKAASTTASSGRCKRLLVSPEFLFRVERDPAGRRVRTRRIASAISSWRRGCRSSCGAASPTTSCSTLAARKQLRDPAVLERQVRRMMADPRFEAFVENFAGQWLYLRNLAAVVPVQQQLPGLRRHAAAGASAARPSCSSRASSARIAARSTCCAPTTRSSTSGWRGTTAFPTSRAAASGASTPRAGQPPRAACSARAAS